jgi:S1-C subfamily serine protease
MANPFGTKSRAALLVCCCGLLSLGATAAMAGPIAESQFSINNWQGMAFTDDQSGGFSSCMISSSNTNGTLLGITVTANGYVAIGFNRPDWAFTAGQRIPGELRIDQRYSQHFEGFAINSTTLRVEFPAQDAIFVQLARGYTMTVSSHAGVGTFDLKDSYRALQLAQSCAQKYQAKVGSPKPNQELQKWIARNPWLTDPRYSEQARKALAIDNQLRAEGKDSTAPAYYAELDRRLRGAGVSISESVSGSESNPSPPPPRSASVTPPAGSKQAQTSKPEQSKTFTASGTGIVLTVDGYVVTNHHVVSECIDSIRGNLTGESTLTLRLVSSDETNDLALLRAPANFKGPASIRGSAIRPGDGIIAIGYPFSGLLSSEFSVTTGIVSSLGGIGNDSRFLQISAPVQPGNSGGPLLDTSGFVVGIVAEKLDALKVAQITGAIPENINFAIKTGALRDFLDKNAVNYDVASPSAEVKVSDIASAARRYTMRILCTARDKN